MIVDKLRDKRVLVIFGLIIVIILGAIYLLVYWQRQKAHLNTINNTNPNSLAVSELCKTNRSTGYNWLQVGDWLYVLELTDPLKTYKLPVNVITSANDPCTIFTHVPPLKVSNSTLTYGDKWNLITIDLSTSDLSKTVIPISPDNISEVDDRGPVSLYFDDTSVIWTTLKSLPDNQSSKIDVWRAGRNGLNKKLIFSDTYKYYSIDLIGWIEKEKTFAFSLDPTEIGGYTSFHSYFNHGDYYALDVESNHATKMWDVKQLSDDLLAINPSIGIGFQQKKVEDDVYNNTSVYSIRYIDLKQKKLLNEINLEPKLIPGNAAISPNGQQVVFNTDGDQKDEAEYNDYLNLIIYNSSTKNINTIRADKINELSLTPMTWLSDRIILLSSQDDFFTINADGSNLTKVVLD